MIFTCGEFVVYVTSINCIFPRNAILVALLYSGFISSTIKLSVYKKLAVYLSGAKNLSFCTISDFGSPTIMEGF